MKPLLAALLMGYLVMTPQQVISQTRTQWLDLEVKYMGGINAYDNSITFKTGFERASFNLVQVGAHIALSRHLSFGYTFSTSYDVNVEWNTNEVVPETKLSIHALVLTYRTGTPASRWRFSIKTTGGLWSVNQTAVANPDQPPSSNIKPEDFYISSTATMISVEAGVSFRVHKGLILYPLEIAVFNLRSEIPTYEFDPPVSGRIGLGYQFRWKKK